MKALFYILILAAVIMSSCATGLYVGAERDDLYYSPSDKPVVSVQPNVPEQIAAGTQKPEQYYNNAYANDTLIADGYNDAVDFDNSMYYNKDNSPFEYMDDFSYSNRLRRFYGNYFDPFWDNTYSYGFGYPSFGFGYGYGYGYPYWGGGMYDPFYYGGGYYGGYYGGLYGGLYDGFYGGYYGSIFSPFFYGGYGYYPGSYYSSNDYSSFPIARRQRYSTLSNNYNPSSPAKKSYIQSGAGSASGSRRAYGSPQKQTTETSRISPVNSSNRQAVTTIPESRYNQQAGQTRRAVSNSSNQVSPSSRPAYKSVDRTYTPSYNNPRMSTRPSYNNSRIQSGTNSNIIQNNSRNNNQSIGKGSSSGNYNSGTSNSGRDNSSSTLNRIRSIISIPGRSESYSVPIIRNMINNSGYSSDRSYSNSSLGSSERSSYSGSSESFRSSSSSSSFSGGSSGSSTSSGSSVSSVSSGGSSSGRRK